MDEGRDNDLSHHSGEPFTLRVTGVTSRMTLQDLELVFENESKFGGGEIKKLEGDLSQGEVLLTYRCQKVAERVLSRGRIDVFGVSLLISRYENPWDGKSVHVSMTEGADFTMDTDYLELIYESKKKSGGGTIRSITLEADASAALISFEKRKDAQEVLEKAIVYLEDRDVILFAQRPDRVVAKEQKEPPGETDSKHTKSPSRDQSPVYSTDNTASNTTRFHVHSKDESTSNTVQGPIHGLDRSTSNTAKGHTNSPDRRNSNSTREHLQNIDKIASNSARDPVHNADRSTSNKTKGPVHSIDKRASNTVKGPVDCLVVTGIKANTSKEYARVFFENRKTCCGGDIDEMVFSADIGFAVITFKDNQVLADVLNAHQRCPITLDHAQLDITSLPFTFFGNSLETVKSRTIMVTDLPASTDEDCLFIFFENARFCGGGKLDKCYLDSHHNQAVLTYGKAEDAANVVAKWEKEGLKYDEHSVSIRVLHPRSIPPVDLQQCEDDRLCVKHVPVNATSTDVQDYFNAVKSCRVAEVIFGSEPGCVLVIFTHPPDFGLVYQHICQVALMTNMVEIAGVPPSHSVEVYGYGSLSGDLLMIYFEHQRSDGGPVEDIKIHPHKQCAVVTFQSRKDALRVVKKQNHIYSGHTLTTPHLHYKCMGILPAVPTTSHSTLELFHPADIVLDKQDRETLAILRNVKFSAEIEETLASFDTQIDLAGSKSGVVVLKCTLQKSATDFREKAKKWERNARRAFESTLSQFCAKEFGPNQSSWGEFLDRTQKLKLEKCDIKYSEKQRKVLVIGRHGDVKQLLEELEKIDKDLALENQVIEERMSDLKLHQLHLLELMEFPQEMSRTFSHVTVKTDIQQGCVIVKGPQSAVTTIMVKIYETFQKMDSGMLPCSPVMCELLSMQNMREMIEAELRAKCVCVHMEVNGKKGVRLFTTQPGDIEKGRRVIGQMAQEVEILLEEGNEQVLSTHEWLSVTEHLATQHPGLIVIAHIPARNQIVIAASSDLLHPVQERIRQYLEENTVLSLVISMHISHIQYVTRHKKQDLDRLKTSSKTISIKSTRRTHQTGFSVTGTSKDLKKAKEFLHQIKNDLMTRMFSPEQKAISGYFEQDQGQTLLKSLEETHKVIIEVDTGDHSSEMTLKATATLRKGKQIFVVVGDITKFTGDAIVNAANTQMDHGGGIAKAIVDSGGQSIQAEGRRYVSQHGPVSTSHAIVSEPGILPCKKIIHTVGPKWKGGVNNEELLLQKAIVSCLDLCKKHDLRSLALPAVSAGVYGFPLQDACNIIVSAIVDCLENGNYPVCEVTLMDRTAVADAFTQSLSVFVGEQRVSVERNNAAKASFPSHLTQIQADHVPRPVQRSASVPAMSAASSGESLWLGTGSRTSVMTSEGLIVQVTSGTLTSVKADAIVNLTSRELDLTHGAVSKSILQAAGLGIQAECSMNYPNGVQYGVLAKTGGHNLSCQYVYHSACEKYHRTSAVQHMKTYIATCLQQAHRDRLTSIAFPSLGTGSLGFPANSIAQILFQEILKFSQSHYQKTSLQLVIIVVFQDNIRKVFESELQALLNPRAHNQAGRQPSKVRKLVSSVVAKVKSGLGKASPKEPPKKLVLRVTGSCKDEYQLDQVIRKLKNACKNEVTVKTFNSRQDQENIKKLTSDQLQRIQNFERSHNVAVKISTAPANCAIEIEGQHRNIPEVIDEIHGIFRERESTEREQYEIEIYGRQAQWKYQENGDFVNYPPDINGLIERAHARGQASARWTESVGGRSREMHIDFQKEAEFEVGVWGRGVKVIRKTPDTKTDLPKGWTAGKAKEEVDQTSAEYKEVQSHFYKSMTARNVPYTKIVKVFRIQNEALYKKYQVEKQHMEQKNPKGVKNERLLWHGTKPTILDEINTNGFNRSFNRSAWYGKGVYFATEAGLSAGSYTTPDANGHKFVYRARVLTGEYAQGHSSMVVPPSKNPANKAIKYDSVVDNTQNPQEWVVFTDSSAYPEYLFQFH